MKAFISYSHKDEKYLERLKVHITQLQREHLVESWTDQEIHAGAALDKTINDQLQASELFIALLSPDYIASNYCYEKEFEKALEMQSQGSLHIVPVIVEPCEWQNTPLAAFKALPKDGKAISLWQNENTAFLDVTTQLRNFLSGNFESENLQPEQINSVTSSGMLSRIKIKKDFDTIQRLDFIEKSFSQITEQLKKNLEEIKGIDSVTTKILEDAKGIFKAILVNRNKIVAESHLVFQIEDLSNLANRQFQSFQSEIAAQFTNKGTSRDNMLNFSVGFDEYEMFWEMKREYFTSSEERVNVAGIIELIWTQWLENIGVSLS